MKKYPLLCPHEARRLLDEIRRMASHLPDDAQLSSHQRATVAPHVTASDNSTEASHANAIPGTTASHGWAESINASASPSSNRPSRSRGSSKSRALSKSISARDAAPEGRNDFSHLTSIASAELAKRRRGVLAPLEDLAFEWSTMRGEHMTGSAVSYLTSRIDWAFACWPGYDAVCQTIHDIHGKLSLASGWEPAERDEWKRARRTATGRTRRQTADRRTRRQAAGRRTRRRATAQSATWPFGDDGLQAA